MIVEFYEALALTIIFLMLLTILKVNKKEKYALIALGIVFSKAIKNIRDAKDWEYLYEIYHSYDDRIHKIDVFSSLWYSFDDYYPDLRKRIEEE